MNFTDEYCKKLCTPEQAVKVIKSGDWVDYGCGACQPIALDKALAARMSELSDI